MKKLTLLSFLLLTLARIYAQKEDKIVTALNNLIKPINSLAPTDNFQDIAFLKEALKSATVVGLGESTHGTALFDTYRQRLIRFLVQEMDYKSIIDEGDILAAEEIDAYINNQTDSLRLVGNIQPVVTNVKELDWLRAYNKTRSETERVHIYGAEVRGFYGIIERLKSLHKFTSAEESVLERFTGDIGIGYENLTKADFESIKKVAEKLAFNCNTACCSHYLSLLNQQIDFAYRQRFGRNDFTVRDLYMFENIKSIVAETPANKTIILAHNGHIQKTKFTTLPSLGYLLNNFYGDKYYTIATDFNTGNVKIFDYKTGGYINKSFNDVTDKRAVEYYFKQCRYPRFILLLNDALKNAVTAPVVNRKTKMLRNMGTGGDIIKDPLILSENYNMIIFINNTSAH